MVLASLAIADFQDKLGFQDSLELDHQAAQVTVDFLVLVYQDSLATVDRSVHLDFPVLAPQELQATLDFQDSLEL